MEDLNKKVRIALRQVIANVHWLVLLGIESNCFTSVIESDWTSRRAGYMLFASKNAEERLLDMGRKVQNFASSSYIGELDTLVWACNRTRAF